MSVSTFSGGGFESKLETEGERILRLILDQAVITAHCTLHCHLCTLHTTQHNVITAHCTLHSTLSSLHIAHCSVIIVKCTVISAHCTLQCHHCKMHCYLCILQCHECILHTTLYCTVIFCKLHSTLSSLQTAHRSPPHCHHCTSHCHRCTVIAITLNIVNCTLPRQITFAAAFGLI